MVRASTVRDDVGFGLLPIVSHSGLAGRPACLFTVAACLFAVAVLFCVSSAHGQVIEEGGFPVKGGGVSGESFSLSCPSRLVVEAGESVLLSCSATAVPEEGVRYGWESVSGDGLRLLSDANERSPLFTAPFSGESAEYVYRLTAMSVGVYETATVTVIVGGVLGETVSAPVVREECGSFGGFGRDQEGCQPWNKAPPQDPFGDSPEDDGIVPWPSFPEGPGAEDKDFPGSSGGDSAFRTAPRLECPVAVFLEELETGSIECHVSDAAGEEHLEYAWEPVGSTTRNYLDNPRLIPEDSPHPSVIAPEAPSYETLESFRSGDRAFRYRYRLTATSRATGLSSHAEVEVFVSSSRPVVYCPLEVSVEEGETARLDCEGADPLSFRMEYDEEAASVLWEWEGLWGTSTAPLDATDLSSPLFTAPAGSAGEEYHYIASMTLSASGVRRTARRRVTVTIVSTEETEEALAVASKASAPSVECEDVAIYEATDDFPLDCEAQEVPDGATYSWTARGSTSGTSELSSMTELTPTFVVPDDIDEPDEANKDYEYMVTMMVGDVAQDSADITVTVLEKPNISCSNTSIAFLRGIAQYGAFAGETRTMTPCFGEFRGAPEGSNYVFTWISADVSGLVVSCTRPETRCVTGGVALAALDRTDRPTATWTAPSGSPWPGEYLQYVYSFRVSAPNADPLTLGPTGLAPNENLPRSKLSITCEDYAYDSYAGGSPDFWDMDCQASGAWFGYTVTWKWDPPTFFTGHDTGTPRYDIPSQVRRDTTFTYTVSVSAPDHDPGEATIAIRVFSTNPTIACSDHTVYEAASDFNLNCRLTFHPPFHPDFATFNWTGTDVAGRLRNTDSVTPRFVVPPNVDADTDYKYTLTMSGPDIFDVTENVAVTVKDRSDITVTCADPGSVYEGAADVAFSCSASGAPPGSYAWSWDPATFLTGHDTGTPTFAVPDVERNTMYTYTVTASATGARSPPVDVKVTVLNKSALSVACTHADTEVYEGAENFALDCEASGAPGDDPQYTYAWTGDATALALLDANDIASPTFSAPDEVTSDETYEYVLTVSAENSDDATLDVAITVLNKKALTAVCANAFAEVYEGAENFALDCEASGAPGDDPQYTYAWTGDAAALALLDANDIASPTFSAPDEVTSDETYGYVLTVSAENSDDATAEVEVTVLNKKTLIVFCPVPASVFEGSEDVLFDCSASGAPGINPDYTYAWTPRGDTPDVSLLSAADIASPTFYVPDSIPADTTYEYTLTVSVENADTHSVDVTLRVLKKGALAIACTIPLSVYEGAENVLFDCEASGALGDDPQYTYAWTGEAAALALLDANDIASPTFSPPPAVDEARTYRYTLTVSAPNADETGLDVAITILNKRALSVACTNADTEVYEGAENFALDCEASGAPGDDPQYTYAWTGDATALALLDANDIASPTFSAPDEVTSDETYEYVLTVSAENSDDATLDVAITVLNKGALAVVCTAPDSVYEGSENVPLGCEASGAPGANPVYTYAWTGDAAALALLDANDIASPTFSVPVEVTSDETYEYTLTVSAQNAGDASLDVAITVLNKKALTAVCANAFAEVYEATADFELNCEASGASGNDPEYTYAWTARGSTLDTSLLSAADIRAPLFHVPDAVSSDETYEYTLTVSAQNAGDTTAEVAVTVLNKKTLVVFCAVPASVFEGSGEVLFDCSASGAPGIDPVYTYAWTGDATAMALLDANDIATPTFSTPDAVDQDKTYRYAVTVSAEHSDTHSLDVTLRVLKAGALSITCTIPVSVYEGAGDVFFDCSASGAPAGSTYEYAWTGDATAMALLDANDIATPTFSTPDEVSSDEMYAYTVTVSAQNVDDDARLYVAITVLKRRALAVACKDPAPVFEGSGEVLFDCSASGAPAGAAYEYAWTARGATPDVSLLSAADVASPTFHVPDKVDATTTYEYLLTARAENAEDATSEVTVTVLNRGALAVVCTDPSPVYEGSADIAFDCSASGAPPGSEYAYVWTARGDTQDTSLLSAADVASPTFHVPAEVDGGETYEYTLTASAENAEDGSAEVTVTVLNKGALAVVCTDPGLVYEGSDDIALDCSASGAPGDSPRYAYVWTARGDTQDTSLLSATDVASPTFHVPAEVDGDETYEYTLTASAENAEDGSAEVTVTVLNKGAPAVVCTYPGSVYEGSDDITLDCSASGAPAGSRYDYVWTARGDTQDTSLLSAADVASPTFHVPAEVGGGETYEYLLTVSAENAEDGSAEVTVTVLDKPVLAVACAGPYSLYEGSEDFAFDCSASGAPGDDPQYTYVWTARGDTQDTSLLSGTDGPAATFLVPDDLPETVTYEYLLTASAENAEDNSAEVSVTVMHPAPLAFVDDTIADRVYVFTVGETIEDIVLPGAKGGFPPYAYTFSPALPPGLAFDDQARTISGTPSEVRPPRGYAWQVSDADAGSVSLAFFIEVAPVPSPATESLSPEPEALSLSAITTSVSPLRFGVQASNTQVILDPTTDRITTHIAGPYHTGRMTLSADGDREPLASAEEIALSVELTSPVLLRREGETVEPAALALSPSWSYTESCEGIPSQSLGGLYTELLLSEGDCPLLLFGGELDLVDALPGRYEGVMDVIIRQGETEETRTLEVDVTVVPAQRVITIGPGGVRFSTSRELSAGLTEEQNLSIYPDVAFLNAGKPHEAFELSNPSLIPLEVSVSARFGYTEATADGREVVVEDIKDSRLGDLSSAVDIHPSLLVLQPGEKGLVRYGIREEALSSLTGKGYAAFFDIVSSPRQYVDQDRLPEEVADDRTARVTMRVPGLYVPGDGASRLQAELLSITEGVSLSATFLVETLDGPFMGEVIAYDGEGRELGRREALVYTRSRVRVPLSRKPDEDVVFLRFSPRGAGRVPEPVPIRWNAPPADIGDAENKARRRIPEKFAQQP